MAKIYGAWALALALGTAGPAGACVGTGAQYGISFRQGAGEELIVRMQDPAGGPAKELSDDIGGLGLHLVLVKLKGIAQGSGGKVDLNRERKLADFARQRGEILVKELNAYLKPAEKASVVPKLRALLDALGGGGEREVKELLGKYAEFNSALYQAGLRMQTRTRMENERGLGRDLSFEDAGVPSTATFRGAGCNAGIANFNTDVGGAKGAAETLPSFDLDTRQ